MSSAPPPPPPQYGAPAPHGVPRNDTKAVLALVLGIAGVVLGWCCFPFGLASVAAIILGRVSQREIRDSQGALAGEGMAKAGFILGIVGVVLTVLGLLLNVFLIAGDGSYFDFYVDSTP